jgi:chromosome segregation ATPase
MAWGDQTARIDRLERRGDRLEELVLEQARASTEQAKLAREIVQQNNRYAALIETLIEDLRANTAALEGINDNAAELAAARAQLSEYEADRARIDERLGGMVSDTQATEDLITNVTKGDKNASS